MATWYVDVARPDDTGDGTSWGTAKKTIAAGVTLLNSAGGDTLKIKSGTYAEPLVLQDKTGWAAWTTIETDDGAGNPGSVVLTAAYTMPHSYGTAGIFVHRTNYVRIDGRQRDGFLVQGGSWTYGVYIRCYEVTSNVDHDVKLLYVGVTGTFANRAIGSDGYYNVEIAYCTPNPSGSLFVLEVQSIFTSTATPEPDPHPITAGVSVHHNDVQGTCTGGYGGLSIKYIDNAQVYENYVHDLVTATGNPVAYRVRQGHDGRFFNNVSADGAGTAIREAWEVRGAEPGGGAHRNWFYNNTHVGSPSYGACFKTDTSSDNKFFNNLVIGSVVNFVQAFDNIGGTGNEVNNNVVTGTVTNWIDPTWPALAASFTVTTGGEASAGTAFIKLTGAVPTEYYDLSASKDGTGAIPATDYNGDTRATPPDVGAFEYIDPTPPPAGAGGGAAWQVAAALMVVG